MSFDAINFSYEKTGLYQNVNQEISSYTTESKVMVFDPSKKSY